MDGAPKKKNPTAGKTAGQRIFHLLGEMINRGGSMTFDHAGFPPYSPDGQAIVASGLGALKRSPLTRGGSSKTYTTVQITEEGRRAFEKMAKDRGLAVKNVLRKPISPEYNLVRLAEILGDVLKTHGLNEKQTVQMCRARYGDMTRGEFTAACRILSHEEAILAGKNTILLLEGTSDRDRARMNVLALAKIGINVAVVGNVSDLSDAGLIGGYPPHISNRFMKLDLTQKGYDFMERVMAGKPEPEQERDSSFDM